MVDHKCALYLSKLFKQSSVYNFDTFYNLFIYKICMYNVVYYQNYQLPTTWGTLMCTPDTSTNNNINKK